MKKLLVVIITFVAVMLAGPGCATTSVVSTSSTNSVGVVTLVTVTNVPSPQTVANVSLAVKALAQTGTSICISKEPGSKAYFAAVVPALDALVSTGSYSPAAITTALQNLPVMELKTANTEAAITGVLSVYEIFFASMVNQKLSQNAYVLPVLQAIRDGIAIGMGGKPIVQGQPMDNGGTMAVYWVTSKDDRITWPPGKGTITFDQ